MRLISADEAYKTITEYYHHRTDIQHKALKEALDRVPTVEERPKGKWITKLLDPELMDCICSNCKHRNTYRVPPASSCDFKKYMKTDYWSNRNYCPNCGADMRGEDNAEI